jgi:1,3-beta-glucanosyltransferase GAS3
LSSPSTCLRDAIVMQNLGLNAIRVYNLDPTANHDDCASIFNAAGIYMVLDVNSPLPGQALNAAEPWTTYDSDYLQHIFGVVEAFKDYDNVLGFFAGNEVSNVWQFLGKAYILRISMMMPLAKLILHMYELLHET